MSARPPDAFRVLSESEVYDGERELLSLNKSEPLGALCLSGGGIRSAAFCLGTLQALDVPAMEVVHPRLGREAVVAKLATPLPEPRMDVHKNARTTRHSRMLMVQRLASGWTAAAVAAAHGVTAKTVRKWRDRFAAEREPGLVDRSSRPHRSPTRLSGPEADNILALRRQRLTGPAIARRLGRPLSTVGLVLRRHGLGRLRALDPRPPVIRYERERPGELLHLDIKKLGRIDDIGHRITGDRSGQSNRRAVGRGLGWEYVHVAIDDASRSPIPSCDGRRTQRQRGGLHRPRDRMVRTPRRQDRAHHERQRLGL